MTIPTFGGKCVLTGAGFTSNFGGLLASEIASRIYNKVSSHKRLATLLAENENYEQVLAEVDSSEDICMANALRQAIVEIFYEQDEDMRNTPGNDGINLHRVWKLFGQMSGPYNPQACSFLFTLNQDIWLERWLVRSPPEPPLGLALLKTQNDFFSGHMHAQHFKSTTGHSPNIILSNAIDSNFDFRGKLNIVKLHGSVNWLDEDGVVMISGGEKLRQSQKWPLLTKYHQVFSEALHTDRTRLLVIGYGFRDKHINDVICSAIEKANLQLWIWNKPAESLEKLMPGLPEPIRAAVRNGGIKYINSRFERIFSPQHSASQRFEGDLEGFLS